MYGTDSIFPNSSALFANQVIKLYTESIGSWSYLIISIAGFSIMFGTCVAVFDGYARSASECIRLVLNQKDSNKTHYDILIWILVFGSLGIILLFGSKEPIPIQGDSRYSKSEAFKRPFEGILPILERQLRDANGEPFSPILQAILISLVPKPISRKFLTSFLLLKNNSE